MNRTMIAAAALAAVAPLATPAYADTGVAVQPLTTVRPVVCGPAYCHQVKTVIAFYGGVQIVVTYRHRRPVESRNAGTVAPWSPWWVVSYTTTRLS